MADTGRRPGKAAEGRDASPAVKQLADTGRRPGKAAEGRDAPPAVK